MKQALLVHSVLSVVSFVFVYSLYNAWNFVFSGICVFVLVFGSALMYFYIVFYYFDFVWSLICNIHVISFVLCVVFDFAFIYVLFGKICSCTYIFSKGVSGILYCVREESFIVQTLVCWTVCAWCIVLGFINSVGKRFVWSLSLLVTSLF